MKSFLCMSRKILSSSVSVSFVNEHLFDTHILCQIMPNNMLLETDVSSASLLAQSPSEFPCHMTPPPNMVRKRSHNHPDAPTPVSSPRSKRSRPSYSSDSEGTQPSILFSPSPSPSPLPSSLPQHPTTNGKITSFFKVETEEEKQARHARDWEDLRRGTDQVKLAAERSGAMQRE